MRSVGFCDGVRTRCSGRSAARGAPAAASRARRPAAAASARLVRDGPGLARNVHALDDLVRLEHVGAGEQLLGRPVPVRLAELLALRPRLEVGLRVPPGHDHVRVALDRAQELEAAAAAPLLDEAGAPLEARLERRLVALRDRDPVRDDDHLSNSSAIRLTSAASTCPLCVFMTSPTRRPACFASVMPSAARRSLTSARTAGSSSPFGSQRLQNAMSNRSCAACAAPRSPAFSNSTSAFWSCLRYAPTTSSTSASSTVPVKPFAVRRSWSFDLCMPTTSPAGWSFALIACVSVSLSCCSSPMAPPVTLARILRRLHALSRQEVLRVRLAARADPLAVLDLGGPALRLRDRAVGHHLVPARRGDLRPDPCAERPLGPPPPCHLVLRRDRDVPQPGLGPERGEPLGDHLVPP